MNAKMLVSETVCRERCDCCRQFPRRSKKAVRAARRIEKREWMTDLRSGRL